MPSAPPVSDYILVTIIDDPFTPTPTSRRFVVEVSRETISKDLSRGNQSRTRTQFHATPELDRFIDERLADVQHVMAGDVALTHAGIIRPQKRPSPVNYSTDPAKAPSHPANAAVGDFRVWEL
jgi:hypothetical protein